VQVNWEALWLPWPQRSLRELLVFPLIIFFLLFPIGLFSGMSAHCNVPGA